MTSVVASPFLITVLLVVIVLCTSESNLVNFVVGLLGSVKSVGVLVCSVTELNLVVGLLGSGKSVGVLTSVA